MDPKSYGSYYTDTDKEDPQLKETARCLFSLFAVIVCVFTGIGAAGKHDNHHHDHHKCRPAALQSGLPASWRASTPVPPPPLPLRARTVLCHSSHCYAPFDYVNSCLRALGSVVAMTKIAQRTTAAPHAATLASSASRPFLQGLRG